MSTPTTPLALPWPAWLTDRDHPELDAIHKFSDEELERRFQIARAFLYEGPRLAWFDLVGWYAIEGNYNRSRQVREMLNYEIANRWMDARDKRRWAARRAAQKRKSNLRETNIILGRAA